MKQLAIFLVAAAFVLAAEPAQAEDTPVVGGFGHFSPGILGGGVLGLNRTLSEDTLLGPGVGVDGTAASIGGGGKIYVGGVMIGGNGFGFVYPDYGTERGSASVGGGGGGFSLGYNILREKYALLYPYVGVGGASIEIQVNNRQSVREIVFGDAVVGPGESRTFVTGFFYYELGIGLQALLLQPDADGSGGGGLIVGAEVGFISSVSGGSWQTEQEEDVQNLEGVAFTGGYFRLTVGGGGFFTD
jgi:hypothetical protein